MAQFFFTRADSGGAKNWKQNSWKVKLHKWRKKGKQLNCCKIYVSIFKNQKIVCTKMCKFFFVQKFRFQLFRNFCLIFIFGKSENHFWTVQISHLVPIFEMKYLIRGERKRWKNGYFSVNKNTNKLNWLRSKPSHSFLEPSTCILNILAKYVIVSHFGKYRLLSHFAKKWCLVAFWQSYI